MLASYSAIVLTLPVSLPLCLPLPLPLPQRPCRFILCLPCPSWPALPSLRYAFALQAYKEAKYFETAYVTRMFQFASLAPPQAAFTFVHPNRATAIDNRRYAVLRFTAACSGVVHGLAGYFDASLHGAAHVSIHPHTHTPGMLSWFPLFFPFRDPLHVRAGQAIEVRMWRCVGAGKVWYEWALTEPGVTAVHNPGGRSYYIGL